MSHLANFPDMPSSARLFSNSGSNLAHSRAKRSCFSFKEMPTWHDVNQLGGTRILVSGCSGRGASLAGDSNAERWNQNREPPPK